MGLINGEKWDVDGRNAGTGWRKLAAMMSWELRCGCGLGALSYRSHDTALLPECLSA